MKLESVVAPEFIESMGTLARSTPPGCFIEVGVYKGGTAQKLYEIAQEQKRDLYLFDTFTGIPIKADIDHHQIGDFADANLELIRKELPLARIYVGVFPHTMPGNLIKDVAFVHVDCDQYQSVIDSIGYLYPCMVVDGIMLFDDYNCLAGATAAVHECFGRAPIQFNNGKAYIVKKDYTK